MVAIPPAKIVGGALSMNLSPPPAEVWLHTTMTAIREMTPRADSMTMEP